MSLLFFILLSSFHFFSEVSSKEIYDLLDKGSIEEIDGMLNKLKAYSKDSKMKAYEGALWTKRASLSSGVKEKVQYFKKGALMLENEIEQKPKDVEYRFLRLAVQENSPSILGYKENLEEDKQMILNNFLSLDKTLRDQILSYSKNSQIILRSELSN